MSSLRLTGQRRPVTIVFTAAAVTAFALVGTASVQAQPTPAAAGSSVYIVQMAGDPVATYVGGYAGIGATKPAAGGRLDARSNNAKALRSRLKVQHDDALRTSGVGAAKRVYDYSVTFNGFAARLTGAEVSKLKATPGVVRVWRNEVLEADTFTTPEFLGLTGANGTWAREFGGPARAGEGVIVGVVDTGFWPENPSFGALPEPRPDQGIINAKWQGICDVGTEQPVSCNNKVIGARWYHAGSPPPADEFTGPRDFNGHGSHTASTAAGNNNVPATINGLAVGNVSGMAPAARIAVYKALWDDGTGQASGTTDDLVAAIEDAVDDGVDVINYSISGSRLFIVDPVEVAFFNAAAAGVFVSTSAGNSGDTIGVSSVAHNAPWTTTVAASTHDRGSTKTVTLGDGRTFNGMGQGPALASAPFVDSANSGLPVPPGTDPAVWATEVTLCFLDRLDPAKVTGKIVLCQRGVNARIEKSLAVREAGGVGMVLYNPNVATVNADFHFVPSIHVDNTVGAALKAYIAGTASPTASLSAGVRITLRAPEMASFSSFGPALAGGGDLLKPDVTAPGVDVVAAVAPPGNNNNNWDSYQGTSMSAPHIAGIAALLKSRNQNWSPMWIKSAIMTTASQTDNSGAAIQRLGVTATPLNYGNGHVRPGRAFDPGLVYDSGPLQWFQYGCATGQFQLLGLNDDCVAVGATDPSDLNYASIAIGDLPGTQTVTRTVTNITRKAGIYDAQVTAPPGITVNVSPSRLVLLPGRSATFKVTFTRTDAAPVGQWAFGSLVWNDKKGHAVHSALAVRPVAVAVASEVTLTGNSGSLQLPVKTGYNGTLTATGNGLTASTVTTMTLVGENRAFDPAFPATGPAVGKVTVTVPAGTRVGRFATFDGDYPAGTDLDLFVYPAGTSTLVASSAGATAEESVTLSAAGSYDIYVVQFALPPGSTQLNVRHHHWTLTGGNAGNLTVTPASRAVTIGGAAPVTVSWTGLATGSRYLGYVEFGNGTAVIGRTILAR